MTGGGFAGKCTVTPGILAQFEIEELLEGGIVPTLDKSTETYWFDDAVRRLLSRDFPYNLCARAP